MNEPYLKLLPGDLILVTFTSLKEAEPCLKHHKTALNTKNNVSVQHNQTN